MKIYTKQGDNGQTSLYGGVRIPKNHNQVEAYGSLDELNSHIGLLRASLPENYTDYDIQIVLQKIQKDLFIIGNYYAFPLENPPSTLPTFIESSNILILEKHIDDWQAILPPIRDFIFPGGSISAAQAHIARTVCRRCERRVLDVKTNFMPSIHALNLSYLNRLSDLLFVLARML